MTEKILIATPIHDCLINKFKEKGYELCYHEQNQAIHSEEIIGIITSNNLEITKELIDSCPLLKWIGRMGSGMEIIDVSYAESKGIKCFSSPEGNANAVAEHALGMLLSLQHHISSSFNELKNEVWEREKNRGHEILGKNIGIIGLGNNGMEFAKKLSCLGMNVFAYDKYATIPKLPGFTICKDLNDIYEHAQILSFHVPLNEETHYYFDDLFLEKMNHDFLLLNLSRGSVVSLDSLYKGMKSGKIYAAALDVWEEEPIWNMEESKKAKIKELFQMPQFIGTPHIGGYTFDAQFKMSNTLLKKIFQE